MNSDLNNLIAFGWNDHFRNAFQQHDDGKLRPARIVSEHRDTYRIQTEVGELSANISGKLRFEAKTKENMPAVGDWVAAQLRPSEGMATIHSILPRRSKFVRKAAGDRIEQQIVGANIDTVFLISSLNNDFNLRRLERYLIVTWQSGARPVIVLSKSDLCEEVDDKLTDVESIAPGVPIHAISAINNRGLDALNQYFGNGQTVALLGSSGVGKSTLINCLIGRDVLSVQPVRESDDRGRHTTTHRQLILLPGGGLVLDTPGMRELQLWEAVEGIDQTFDDIESFAAQCRFRDCQHQDEPGCAIVDALKNGQISEARYRNYEKIQRELRYLAIRQDQNAQRTEKARWKKLCRLSKERSKMKRM